MSEIPSSFEPVGPDDPRYKDKLQSAVEWDKQAMPEASLSAEQDANVQRIINQVRSSLYAAVEQGVLPIARELIDIRFDETRIAFVEMPAAKGGDYEPLNGVIHLNVSEIDSEGLERTILHESIHMLAGKEILAPSDKMNDRLMLRRNGLSKWRFSGASSREEPYWLDEAITEALTQNILGTLDTTHYRQEREFLALLMTRGKQEISWEDLITAYFDTKMPNLPSDHYENLLRKIEEAYEPGFLQKLDVAMQSGHDFEVEELLKQNWK